MYTVKNRSATLQKLTQIQTIHSLYQGHGPFKNVLSLVLRKSCKQFNPPCEKKKDSHKLTIGIDKISSLPSTCHPSVEQRKKISFEKLKENRRNMKQRGRIMNGSQKNQRCKMIALEEYHKLQKKDSQLFRYILGVVKIKIAKNGMKTETSCQAESHQLNETTTDEGFYRIGKAKKTREYFARMSLPVNKYKRKSTMPDDTEDNDIKLCPWEATQ